MMRRYRSALGEVGVVVFAPEPHNSICPGFCLDLCRIEPPGVRGMEPQGPWRVGLVDIPWQGGTISLVHRKVGGIVPVPKPHNSVTDTP